MKLKQIAQTHEQCLTYSEISVITAPSIVRKKISHTQNLRQFFCFLVVDEITIFTIFRSTNGKRRNTKQNPQLKFHQFTSIDFIFLSDVFVFFFFLVLLVYFSIEWTLLLRCCHHCSLLDIHNVLLFLFKAHIILCMNLFLLRLL